MSVALDADRMGRTLTRIAHEILERNRGVEELALVGIRTRGVPLAKRLARAIVSVSSKVPKTTGAKRICQMPMPSVRVVAPKTSDINGMNSR